MQSIVFHACKIFSSGEYHATKEVKGAPPPNSHRAPASFLNQNTQLLFFASTEG